MLNRKTSREKFCRKALCLAGLMLFLLPTLTGCGGQQAALPACETVAQAVQDAQTFEELTALSSEKLAQVLGVDAASLADQTMRMDVSRATAECIVVLTASDSAALKTLSQALLDHRNALIEQYRDYQPDEIPKLENAVLRNRGLQTVLVVSPEHAKANEALDAAWK